jgi:hypothetical protein
MAGWSFGLGRTSVYPAPLKGAQPLGVRRQLHAFMPSAGSGPVQLAHVPFQRRTRAAVATRCLMNRVFTEYGPLLVSPRVRRRVLAFGFLLMALGWLSQRRAAECQAVEGVSIEEKDLTPAEMAQVRRLVRPIGKEPWLIYGFRYGPGRKSRPRPTQVTVYLQPDVEHGRLRRGRVLHVEVGGTQQASARIESTGKYAHVVVLGRRPDEGRGKWDPHRPFLVEGDFDDQTLLKVVARIRQSHDRPPPLNGSPARLDGLLPISRVRRIDNRVEVTLNVDETHGEGLTLEERNGRLVIVKHGFWIA